MNNISAVVPESTEVTDTASTTTTWLMTQLWNKMRQNGHNSHTASHSLGCSYPYLMALIRGERPSAGMSRQLMLNIATYLGVPPVHVFIQAGAMETSDFFVIEELPGKLSRLHDVMRSDPKWMSHMPSRKEWDSLGEKAQILIGLLYENCGGFLLMSPDEKCPNSDI